VVNILHVRNARPRENRGAQIEETTMPTSKAPLPATKPSPKRTPAADRGKSPSDLIDARIAELGDWRGELLSRLRALIRDADSEIAEEWKWNTPVWCRDGIICTGETYRKVVKLTFAKGASVPDPTRLFNSSLEGNVRRAIDFPEGVGFDAGALKALVRAAVALNRAGARGKPKRAA
jgi:hypothetical protein